METQTRKHDITIKEILKTKRRKEWSKIDLNYLKKLIASVPTRLEKVILAKGGHTKYGVIYWLIIIAIRAYVRIVRIF